MSTNRRTHDAVIGLGANLGDRLVTLRQARDALLRVVDAEGAGHTLTSSVYESPALGPPQPHFLNAAVRISTSLEPLALLEGLLDIERRAGRVRRERWGPRTLDLDVLWLRGEVVDTPRLRVPHPELLHRPFAILPLLDVAPDAVDPRTGAPYADVLRQLDRSNVVRIATL